MFLYCALIVVSGRKEKLMQRVFVISLCYQPQLRQRLHNDLHHQPASVAKENQVGGDVTEQDRPSVPAATLRHGWTQSQVSVAPFLCVSSTRTRKCTPAPSNCFLFKQRCGLLIEYTAPFIHADQTRQVHCRETQVTTTATCNLGPPVPSVLI